MNFDNSKVPVENRLGEEGKADALGDVALDEGVNRVCSPRNRVQSFSGSLITVLTPRAEGRIAV